MVDKRKGFEPPVANPTLTVSKKRPATAELILKPTVNMAAPAMPRMSESGAQFPTLLSAGNQAVQHLLSGPNQAGAAQTLQGKNDLAIVQPVGGASQFSSTPQPAPEVPAAALTDAQTTEKAPSNPEMDPGHQAVVEQLNSKARGQKAPLLVSGSQAETAADDQIKGFAQITSHRKTTDTQSAAQLPAGTTKEQTDKTALLQELDQKGKQLVVTVDGFVQDFDTVLQQLAKKVPDSKKNYVLQIVALSVEKVTAEQAFAKQNQTRSEPIRDELRKDPAPTKKDQNPIVQQTTLIADDPGKAPTIPGAQNAAPKPKKEKEISLSDKSKALDDMLENHNVGGQSINIDEGSLAYPVSGEKSFDEAGQAKREAQAEIEKAGPKYREEESAVIGKSQGDIRSMVAGGLNRQHSERSKSFGGILETQKSSQGIIIGQKQKVFGEFIQIYENTKKQVADDLQALDGIDAALEAIINKAQENFNDWVRKDLEYIYTPGHWGLDYSDWIDKPEVKAEIKEEYERLMSQKVPHFVAQMQATDKARETSAKDLFRRAKTSFITDVKFGVEFDIAPIVVKALNTAKYHITKGQQDAIAAFDKLSEPEKKEAKNVFKGVIQKFGLLSESVDERKREIITDMARAYNKSIGQLDTKFAEIKKDVLTSWLEKAWNKLKAVVNAIIEFASRIAELLGRLAYLVGDIVTSPRAFFRNLISGIGQGFSTFVEQIDVFLATAFFDWLRGSSGLPIQIPKSFGPSGIFSLFTQLLGLSTETIWKRMEVVYNKTIANAFRRGESLAEKGLEVFETIKNEGLGGLWEHIKESLGDILSETLDTIKETILYEAIKKVMIEIGKMLIPGGGFIAIAGKIVDLLKFIVEARDKILDLIEAFVDSVEMAVKGDVSGIANHVTGALTKFIAIAIDFLVSFFGLGGLHEKVERILNRIQKPIIAGIDWVLNKLKPLVMKVYRRVVKEPIAEEMPERAQPGLEESRETVHPAIPESVQPAKEPVSAEKPQKAHPDLALAKQTVKQALALHLPDGARLVADVDKVLASVAAQVTPALSDLHAEEFMPGKPKAEGAIGFTVRAREQTGERSLIASVRFSGKQKLQIDEIRARALTALKQGLGGLHTHADAQTILDRLGERLRPEGVKSFELSPGTVEGQSGIYVNINPQSHLGNLVAETTSMPKRRDVVASIELTMAKPVQVDPAVIASASGRGEPYGAEVLKQRDDNSTIVQMVSWNTSDILLFGNDSHAEHQFVAWLKKPAQQLIRQNLKEIAIVLDSFSPCSHCSGELAVILTNIKNEQKKLPDQIKQKGAIKANIYWKELYSGSSTNPVPTNWQRLEQMRAAGWEMHAPFDQWPPKEENIGISGKLRYEGGVMWRLVPDETPVYTQAPVRRRQGGALTSAIKEKE